MNKIVVPILGPGLKFTDLPAALSNSPGVQINQQEAPGRIMDAMKQIAVSLAVTEKTGGKVRSKLDDFVSTFRSSELARYPQEVIFEASKSETIKLSAQAKELLIEAVQDPHGIIDLFHNMNLSSVHTHGKNFEGNGTPRARAAWEAALRQLEQSGLVKPEGKEGQVFTVTDLGYQVADEIQGGEPGSGNEVFSEKDRILILQQWLEKKRGIGFNVERFAEVDKLVNLPSGSAKSYLATAAKELGLTVETEADQTIRIDYDRYL